MKLNCTVDGTQYSLNVAADKPLNLIISEISSPFPKKDNCTGASCGNCIVLINGSAALSCLIPAFKANGKAILTYSGFRITRFCHYIERAYAQTGIYPCSQCYAAKTILIGGLLNRFAQSGAELKILNKDTNRQNNSIYNLDYIEKEFNLIQCNCLEISKLAQVIELAYAYRRRRSG